MRNIKTRKILCIRCNEIFKTKAPNTKYCKDCKKIVVRETNNRCYRKNREKRLALSKEYGKKYSDRHLKNKIKKVCANCNELKPHFARGLCKKCYRRWIYLIQKTKSMTESERHEYFIRRGFLEDKKEFTIEDLKRDLGVTK